MSKYLTPFEMGAMVSVLSAARHKMSFRVDRRAERSLLRKKAILLQDDYWTLPSAEGLELYVQGLYELHPPSKHLLVRVLFQGGFLTKDQCSLSSWNRQSAETAEVFGLVKKKRSKSGVVYEISEEGRRLLNAWDAGLAAWFPVVRKEKSPLTAKQQRLVRSFEEVEHG